MRQSFSSLSRRPLTVLAVLALAGASAAACGSGGSAGGETPDLAGKTFESTSVTGHDIVEGAVITLTFEEDRVSANAGCNTINGAATWEGGTLEAGPMVSTMMACDEALMAQDAWLTEFLESSPAVSQEGSELTLGDATLGIVLEESAG